MKVRVTYRMELTVEGGTLSDCRKEWESAPFYEGDFIEVVSVENAEDSSEISIKDFENAND